jgi:hypothetical protein
MTALYIMYISIHISNQLQIWAEDGSNVRQWKVSYAIYLISN